MLGFRSQVAEISAEEVNIALTQNKECILLDVRTAAEYLKGHIPGSINVPLDEITTQIDRIITQKDIPVFTYCLSGSRSQMAVAEMLQLGFTKVFSLTSGLLAWRSLNYPVSETQ